MAASTDDPLLAGLQPEQQNALLELQHALKEELGQERCAGLVDDPHNVLRYLRARKWDIDAARCMMAATLQWQEAFGIAGLHNGDCLESIRVENATGKMCVRGFDRCGRPIVLMKPHKENSSDAEGIVRHMVYCLERAVACINVQKEAGRLQVVQPGDETGRFVILCDFSGFSVKHMPPLSVAKDTVQILQDHYPERLAKGYVVNAPWWLSQFFNAIAPFMDSVTKDKFEFLNDRREAYAERMSRFFDLSVLEPEFGGTATTPFWSHIFTQCKHNGTEFGIDYNEQYKLFESQSSQGGALEPQGALAELPDTFWQICSDPDVLRLQRAERGLVRDLARRLCRNVDNSQEHEGLFDNAGAILRYLDGDWNIVRAEQRLRATAKWRKQFGFSAQRNGKYADDIEKESLAGAMYVRGFDESGRPIIYFKLRHWDSKNHEGSLRYWVYCLERALACIEQRKNMASITPSVAEVTVLVDFAGYSFHRRPTLRTVRHAATLLQEHYPGRLGALVLLWPPVRLWPVLRMARQLRDHGVCDELVVVRTARQHHYLMNTVFNSAAMECSVGGELAGNFSPSVFLSRSVGDVGVYGLEFQAQCAALKQKRVSFNSSVERSDGHKKAFETLRSNGEENLWNFTLATLFGEDRLW